MKELALKVARTALAIGVVAGFVWLNWWVLPDLAFITLEAKGSSLPATGYTLDGYQNGKYIGSRVLKAFALGWPGVAAGWPYVFIGILGGLSMGYVVGEFTRRKLGAEEITKEAEDEWKEKMNTADEKESSAIRMLALALKWREEIEEATKKSAHAGDQARLVDVKVQQQHASEEKLKKPGIKEKDVLNARDKIKRLDAKIEGLEKMIDELKKSP